MKKNFIIYSISLIIILASVIVISFAWFTSNKDAKSNAPDVMVGDFDGKYSLEAYINDSWQTPDEILYEEIFPGDTMYFRFKIEANSDLSFSYRLEDITVEINDITYQDNGIYYQNQKIYDVLDNSVSVTLEDENNTSVVLYTISDDGNINISEGYTIDNALKLYNLGISESEIESIPENTTGEAIDTKVEAGSISKGTNYYYFAISYPETLNDNLYQFQKIKIDHIRITEA